MDLMKIISKSFDGKFSFIKLLKVVFNTALSACTVYFIYPENVESLTTDQKNEIKNLVINTLNINSKIECKFSKSYLDKDIVENSIFDYLKNNFDSISGEISSNNINYSKKDLYVEITITCNQTVYDYINENNIQSLICKHLENNFCGEFNIITQIGGKEFNTKTLEDRAELILDNIEFQAKTPRYYVKEPSIVFGGEITPMPEYIKNIAGEKMSVILAGYVENLTEKEYLPKKNKEKGIDEKRKYYTFELNDNSGKINCIHFCTKLSQKHFPLIENGKYILCLGDYTKRSFGGMQYSIKAISLSGEVENKEVTVNNTIPSTYKYATPEPIIRTIQNNLFEVKKKYPDWILNKNWVVFDCETTGLKPAENDITEIGAVKIINGEIKERFQHLCKPFEPIPGEIVKKTGITNEMVENMPTSFDILQDFLKFSDGCVLVGYNVNFDYQFISNVAKRNQVTINFETHDCLNDARTKIAYLPNYKLGTLVAHLGITLDNAHRALYDATATAEAFLALSLFNENTKL